MNRKIRSKTENQKEQTGLERAKPPGKPFQPGEDPRRHMAGRKCKSAIEFSKDFNRALAGAGDPAALAALLWKRAMAGHAWAVDTILDRLLGKQAATAIVQQDDPAIYRFLYKDGTPVYPHPEFPKDPDKAGVICVGPAAWIDGLEKRGYREISELEKRKRLLEHSKDKGEDHDPGKN